MRASSRHALVAVASRDQERGPRPTRASGASRAFTRSYETLIDDPEIDAIYNPLPNALHAAWTIRAVRAGKHVLCEKPLATTVADVDAIAREAKAAGVVVSEAFMYRHHPQTLRLKALVDERAIGKLRLIRSAFTFPLTRSGDVRWEPALGGGSLWDVGCYPVSIARLLAGVEPQEVFGRSRHARGRRRRSVHRSAGARRRGRAVRCRVPRAAAHAPRGGRHRRRDHGGLTVQAWTRTRGCCCPAAMTSEVVAVESQPLYLGELDDLADAATLGREPRVSLADSRGNVAALVALYESARTGRPVAVAR